MKWHIVHTRPRWEKKVHNSLIIKGIQSFCPINKVHRQWSDRIKVIEEPLFTGHVFVKICDDDRMQVRLTAGVRNIVYADGKPSILKEREINCIRKFSESYNNIKLFKNSVAFENGVEFYPFNETSDFEVFGKLKIPSLHVTSLGFILFADSIHPKVQGLPDKT